MIWKYEAKVLPHAHNNYVYFYSKWPIKGKKVTCFILFYQNGGTQVGVFRARWRPPGGCHTLLTASSTCTPLVLCWLLLNLFYILMISVMLISDYCQLSKYEVYVCIPFTRYINPATGKWYWWIMKKRRV